MSECSALGPFVVRFRLAMVCQFLAKPALGCCFMVDLVQREYFRAADFVLVVLDQGLFQAICILGQTKLGLVTAHQLKRSPKSLQEKTTR